jgi:hypothetical protein
MRKRFGLVFFMSLFLTLAIGAAYAWTASTSGSFSASAGTVSMAFDSYAGTGYQVYPTNNWIDVEYGNFKNTTPANPGLPLQLTGGTVSNIASDSDCEAYMGGQVVITDASFVAPGGYTGGQWYVQLYMVPSTPNYCQGDSISYDLNLTAGS